MLSLRAWASMLFGLHTEYLNKHTKVDHISDSFPHPARRFSDVLVLGPLGVAAKRLRPPSAPSFPRAFWTVFSVQETQPK